MSVNTRSESPYSEAPASAARYAANLETARFLNDLADLYIAGPMTGLPDLNYPAFYEAERLLISLGFTVENPAWNGDVEVSNYIDYLRLGFQQLTRCKGIYLLDGWENSKGAFYELQLAQSLKMGIHFEGEFGIHNAPLFKP